jgi:hypothetical protein
MSNIEINEKNDWFLIALLAAAAIWIVISLSGCAPKLYQYKILFDDGNYDYYDLTYKLKKGSRAIEYDGETIMGVKDFELIK